MINLLIPLFITTMSPTEKYISTINPNIPKESMEQIINSVSMYSYRFNLPEELLYAIIHTESRFDLKAVSHTRDYGLMQINHNTAKEFLFNKQMLVVDINYSILCGAYYLSYLRNTYKGDKYWWARYHSSTPEFKQKYIKSIKRALRSRYEIRGH